MVLKDTVNLDIQIKTILINYNNNNIKRYVKYYYCADFFTYFVILTFLQPLSPYAVPGSYPQTYVAPKSPPGGIRPKVIKKPDDHNTGTDSSTIAMALAGGAVVGGIGAFASMEYMEKQAQVLKEQE